MVPRMILDTFSPELPRHTYGMFFGVVVMMSVIQFWRRVSEISAVQECQ